MIVGDVGSGAAEALCQGDRGADALADAGQGAHQAHGAEGEVRDTHEAAGKPQVVEVAAVAGAVREAPQRRDAVEHDAGAQADRLVNVDAIAAVANAVWKGGGGLDVGLREHVVADEAVALALAALGLTQVSSQLRARSTKLWFLTLSQVR